MNDIDEVMEAFGEKITDDLIDQIKDMQQPLSALPTVFDMRTHDTDHEKATVKRGFEK